MGTLIWVCAGRSHSVGCPPCPLGGLVRYEAQWVFGPNPMAPTVCNVMSPGWPAEWPDAKSTVGGLVLKNAIAVKTTKATATPNRAPTMTILPERLTGAHVHVVGEQPLHRGTAPKPIH